MRIFSVVIAAAIVSLLLVASMSSQGKKAAPPGKVDAYSISAVALKGAVTTDISIEVVTTDVINYPLPHSFKKLLVTVYDDLGNVLYNRNLFDVPISGATSLVTVDGLQPLLPVRIQGQIKTPKTVDEEVSRTSARVFLRPDLRVANVSTPEKVTLHSPFDVTVTIREFNMQLGATAVVSLWDGMTSFGSVPGVVVAAGGQVSVVFQGIHLETTGLHTLTARASDSNPADYDESNNELAAEVEVVNPVTVTPVSGSFQVVSVRNYFYNSNTTWCNGWYTFYQQSEYDVVYAQINLAANQIPASPIDKFSWEFLSGNGTISHGSLSNLTPYYSDGTYEYYDLSHLESDGRYFYCNMYLSPSSGWGYLYVQKVAQSYFYVYRYNDGSTGQYQQNETLYNFQDFVEIRLLLQDDDISVGGGVRLDVLPFSHVSNSYSSSWDYDGCTYTSFTDYSYDQSYTRYDGLTDPSLLPSSRSRMDILDAVVVVAPGSTQLLQNYPNPFNPATNIEFSVEQGGQAVVKVYNTLGQEVAELFNGLAEQGRMYQVRFDARALPSGMYYAKFDAAGKQFVKKMVFAK